MADSKCINLGRAFHKQHKGLFDIGDLCFDLGDIIIKNINDRNIAEGDVTLYQKILSFNFYKATNSFLSVLHLCDGGFGGDAMSITRKIIEIAIQMNFLSQEDDFEKKVNRYWYYGALSNYRNYRNIIKNKANLKDSLFSENVIKNMEKKSKAIMIMYDTAKKYFPQNNKGEVPGKFFNNWSGLNYREMAVRCGMKTEGIGYILYSSKIHTSIEDITAFYNFKNRTFDFGREVEEIPTAIIESLRMYLIMCELMINAFSIDLKSSLEYTRKRLKEEFESRKLMSNQ